MLQVSGLSCERDRRQLFEALDFSLGASELLQIQGGNGSGKSTLIRILLGLFTDFTGSIDWSLDQPPLYLGHRGGVKPVLTVEENLIWFSSMRGLAPSSGEISGVLARIGLEGYEDALVGQLSEGQRKRVGLARFLLCPNACWIMDEPFSAVDKDGLEMLRGMIREHLGQAGSVIFSSHQGIDIDYPLRTVVLN